MFAKSVFITGSNRGIGLELVKQLAPHTQHLFAACRTPSQAKELKAIADKHNHVVVLELDVVDEEAIAKAVNKVTEVVGDNGLNCLISNAGSMDKSVNCIEDVTAESLKTIYSINAVAPAMIAKAFLPLLRIASSLASGGDMSVSRAAILNMSTRMASIDDNSSGACYAYRMSKVALNMLTKNLSIELKSDHILAITMHPGWVLTDMGGPNALISTEKSVTSMLKLFSDFTEKHNGMFYGWNDVVIPW